MSLVLSRCPAVVQKPLLTAILYSYLNVGPGALVLRELSTTNVIPDAGDNQSTPCVVLSFSFMPFFELLFLTYQAIFESLWFLDCGVVYVQLNSHHLEVVGRCELFLAF